MDTDTQTDDQFSPDKVETALVARAKAREFALDDKSEELLLAMHEQITAEDALNAIEFQAYEQALRVIRAGGDLYTTEEHLAIRQWLRGALRKESYNDGPDKVIDHLLVQHVVDEAAVLRAIETDSLLRASRKVAKAAKS